MSSENPIQMGRQVKDLTGKRFGSRVVKSFAGTHVRQAMWNCLCDCGRMDVIGGKKLRSGLSGQCRECAWVTHGHARNGPRTPEYKAWLSMMERCTCKTHKQYPDYGGRGITVCERWTGEQGFTNFLADMGLRPSKSHSIDRFPDNNAGYCKENCRWATRREQMRNTRKNRMITFNGETFCVAEWAVKIGLHREVLRGRLERGWTLERALQPLTPARERIRAREIRQRPEKTGP